GGEGIPRQHARSVGRARDLEGDLEVETIAAEHAAERDSLGLADHLARGIERLDEQPYVRHAAPTIVVEIAGIDGDALLRLSHLGIDAEAPSVHLSVDDPGNQDQGDYGGERRPTGEPQRCHGPQDYHRRSPAPIRETVTD